MRKLMLLCASLCAMAYVVPAKPAHAQTLAWVSPTGTNTGTTCSETAPCATFQYVVSNVSGVAQINCLGSGSYGPVAITGSLVIDCGDGNIGEIASTVSNAAININTGSTAIIVLRHLSLNGGGTTDSGGINTENFAGGMLIVEDCVIHGFHPSGTIEGVGINFGPSSGGRGTLQVSNSLIYDNGYAIGVEPASGQIASVALNRVELVANQFEGLDLGNGGTVVGTMRHSLVAGNGNYGVNVSGRQAFFTVEESSIVDNLSAGITINSSGAVNVGASTIGGNGTGVEGGSLISFGNNQMSANGANGSFSGVAPLQ
jgi:hypothetical protein